MSVQYKVLKRAARLIGLKNMWGGNVDELIAKKKKQNAKNRIPELHDMELTITKTEVMGFPVLRMTHIKRAEKANLFLIGGGMVSPPRPASVKKALRFAKETGLDLFIPYYPLCTDYPLTKAYEMVHETYRVMLREYRPENISLLGTSSGGNLALGLVAYINAEKLDTPMPGHIMAISPGTCVASDEEWRRMLELDKVDVAIPAQYMKDAEIVMRCGDCSVPDYMIRLQNGDFTNCPRVTFMYGSDETLYACAPSFERAMQKYGVDYEMIVGKGMFHCYPVFPVVPEAKEGWRQMVDIMRGSADSAAERKNDMLKRSSYQAESKENKDSSKYKALSVREFTKAAEIYDSGHAGIYEMCKDDYPPILEELKKEPFADLLDVGCGTGPMIELLAKEYPDRHYTGLDLTPKMIEVAAAKRISNAEFVVGDSENLPFEKESFDAVICANSFHHYPNPQKFFDGAARVLRPGGRLILRDYTAAKPVLWLMNHTEMPLANLIGHGDVRAYSREEVRSFCEGAGLEVLTLEKRSKFRLHLVAVKRNGERMKETMSPDYKNWVPKGMMTGFAAGAAALAAGGAGLAAFGKSRGTKALSAALELGAAGCGAFALWCAYARNQFSYDGKRKLSHQIVEGTAEFVTLPEGGVGLDVGCGSGALTIACAKRNPQGRMVGCDAWGPEYASFSRQVCEQNAAAEGVENVSFRVGNAKKLPFADESFDAVTSNYVYHNVMGADKQKLLRETLRTLKKGGTFAIHDIMSRQRYGDMRRFCDELRAEGYEKVELIDTTNGRFMSRAEAATLFLTGSAVLCGKK